MIGLDVGVKGSFWCEECAEAWNLTGTGPQDDKLRSAVWRGSVIAGIIRERVPIEDDVAIDMPRFVPTNSAYNWGLQCALYGACIGGLRSSGYGVFEVTAHSVRKILGISGRGKVPIIRWAAENGCHLIDLPKWKRETISESFMLAEAAKRMRVNHVERAT